MLAQAVLAATSSAQHLTDTLPEITDVMAPKKRSPLGKNLALETCTAIWSHAIDEYQENQTVLDGRSCLDPTIPPPMMFVHVAKSCGSSVGSTLTNNRKLFMDRFGMDEPASWSATPFLSTVHGTPVRKDVIDGCGHYVVVSVRDPVDRFVSAFNTLICLHDPSVADRGICNHHSSKADRMMRLDTLTLTRCFPNVTALADALDDESTCGRAARYALGSNPQNVGQASADLPERPLGDMGHVAKGSCYYLGGLLDTLREKNVFVVDADSCDEDMQRIPGWLDLSGDSLELSTHVGDRKVGESEGLRERLFPHHNDMVSEKGRANLRKYLEHEYAFQDELRELAKTPHQPKWVFRRHVDGRPGCPEGMRNAREDECLEAVHLAANDANMRGGIRPRIKDVDDNSGSVPPGCTMNFVTRRPVFNRAGAGAGAGTGGRRASDYHQSTMVPDPAGRLHKAYDDFKFVCIGPGPEPNGGTLGSS